MKPSDQNPLQTMPNSKQKLQSYDLGLSNLLLPPRRSVYITAVASLTAILALLLLLNLLYFERKQTNFGFVVSDTEATLMSSPVGEDAIINRILVSPGDLVVPGQAVALLGVKSTHHHEDALPHLNAIAAESRDNGNLHGERRLLAIHSTQRGYVSSIIAEPNQTIPAHAPVLLLDKEIGRLILKILADGTSAVYLKVGQRVTVRVNSLPFQKFGTLDGYVKNISPRFLSPAEVSNMFGVPPPDENRFLVEIAVDNADKLKKHLKPGMKIAVDLPIERMTLFRWILKSFSADYSKDAKQ